MPAVPPLAIDADGLKLLAKLPDWPEKLPGVAVLTPHPGEMAVLTGWKVADIQADRLAAAEQFASQWNHVVVLKGAHTVIAEPGGKSRLILVATPALAPNRRCAGRLDCSPLGRGSTKQRLPLADRQSGLSPKTARFNGLITGGDVLRIGRLWPVWNKDPGSLAIIH
jgi:hypothetical protein